MPEPLISTRWNPTDCAALPRPAMEERPSSVNRRKLLPFTYCQPCPDVLYWIHGGLDWKHRQTFAYASIQTRGFGHDQTTPRVDARPTTTDEASSEPVSAL